MFDTFAYGHDDFVGRAEGVRVVRGSGFGHILGDDEGCRVDPRNTFDFESNLSLTSLQLSQSSSPNSLDFCDPPKGGLKPHVPMMRIGPDLPVENSMIVA